VQAQFDKRCTTLATTKADEAKVTASIEGLATRLAETLSGLPFSHLLPTPPVLSSPMFDWRERYEDTTAQDAITPGNAQRGALRRNRSLDTLGMGADPFPSVTYPLNTHARGRLADLLAHIGPTMPGPLCPLHVGTTPIFGV